MTAGNGRALAVTFGAARHRPGRFVAAALLWVAWWSVPAVVGLLLQATFDAVAGGAPVSAVTALLVVLAAVEVTRLVVFVAAVAVWVPWWVAGHTLLRTNLLRAQLVSGRAEAGAPVRDAGQAVAVFRDDAEDVMMLADGWIDLAGALAFAVVAVAVLLRVDATLTLVAVAPLVATFAVTRVLSDRIRRVRRADREATARVTGFLGDVFAAVLAVKVAGAEDRIVARLRELNARRRRTSLRDKVLTDALYALNGSTVDLTIGLVLLLVAGRMRAGTFSVGDLALFASYLTWLAGLPRWAGMILARQRHAEVATGRMAALLPGGDETEAVRPRALPLDHWAPAGAGTVAGAPAGVRPVPAAVRLRGFGVRHRGGGGVSGVDLDLPSGSFTVVCGPVGAGKSTLLRGLLGLAGDVEGTVTFDGAPVDDLAAFMVPPRCAFVPQVPRLFGASLRDNLLLGRDLADEPLRTALHSAAFDTDVAVMPAGLDTVVGPRGVRLSGGQLQRAATARALAGGAALLVLDDLSSALDAATEQRLWRRLLDGRGDGAPAPTVLVVSHRAAALAHADQVVLLDGGRVRATGTLAELRAAGLDPLAGVPDRRVRR